MKVAIIGAAYPLRGGIAQFASLLAVALRRRHDVDTITFRRQYPALLFPGSSQFEGGEIPGIQAAEQLIDSLNPLNWISVGRMIKGRKPDCVVFQYSIPFFAPCFGTMARTIRRDREITILFLCHNIVPHEKRPGDTALTRYAFAPADGFIVQSATVERDLLALIPDARHELVPHPVYSSFGEPMPAEEARRHLGTSAKFVLLFFGYIRAYKGLGTLLDAMALLKGHLDIHLFVVGEFYDEVRRYRDTLSTLGLDTMVTIRAEYVTHEEARMYFSAADAAVLPYLSATQSGIAQVAYNFDTPVIATAVGGLAEVVRDGITGFLVPPGDPGSLAAAITRFFTATDRDAMRLRIRDEKKKYSWDALVDAIENLASRA